MQGVASREAVLDMLLEQERTGAFLKDLFPRYADTLPPADRGLAREIALGVIRHKSLLDYNIDALAARKPGPGLVRHLLRLAAYQVLFLDVPDFAAVNTAVELAKRRAGREKSGFINALLKRLSQEGMKKAPGETLGSLAINYSHPLWLVERWHKRLGPQGLKDALERNNQEAPLWIRVNTARCSVEAAQAALAQIGVEAIADPYAARYLRLPEGGGAGGKVIQSEAFARGDLAVQDPAAWLVAELADAKPGEKTLDLCAAPGGKAAVMVERAGEPLGAGRVVCNDLSFRRLRRIRDARERLGHTGLLPLVMDPAHGALKARFDCIVVDAPCSNLGVLRRRPEARWSHGPGDLLRLAEVQKALLRQAAALAAPRGRIVYATCSPEPEESMEVVKAFLAGHPEWILEDAGAFLPAWAAKKKYLWLHPGETEYDGFFAARLARKP